MPRTTRALLTTAAAEPPEAVTVESDFVVILAALLCALICVVGLIAVARCAWLRRGGGNRSNTSPSRSAANKGLKKKVLQSLPKYTYTISITADSGCSDRDAVGCAKFASTECSICLGEFNEGEEIRVLPQCGHCFHVVCIDTWLGNHSSCPSCRQILVVATRCQKCGHLPSTTTTTNNNNSNSASTSGGTSHNVEFKPTSSSNRNPSSSSNQVPIGGFLP